MKPRKPPIRCIPCRVSYRGHRYQINSDVTAIIPEERYDVAREVRREAARLRRNRNARERNQALTLG